MEKVTDEMMNRLSRLAALDINDSQKDIIKSDLKNMIEYIEIIKTLDVDEDLVCDNDVDKESVLTDRRVNVLRKDEEYITPVNKSAKMIENAPQTEGAYIVVPKTT